MLLMMALLHAPALWAQSIGVVAQAEGKVQILRGENVLEAGRGVELEAADIVETAAQAGAQLDMEDGSILKLGPATRLVLAEYKLDTDKSVVSSTLDLLSGWMRFAVAKLRPTGNYAMNTPSLTIGVRGTEGTIGADAAQAALDLHEGAVDVSPFGSDRKATQPLRVKGGEYVERRVGQDFTRHARAPAGFAQRVPPGMQRKLARQPLPPKARGTSPRVLRAVTPQDRQRLLKENPQFKQRLQPRFGPATTPKAGAASAHQRKRDPAAMQPGKPSTQAPRQKPPMADDKRGAPKPHGQPKAANSAPRTTEKKKPRKQPKDADAAGSRERGSAPYRGSPGR